MTRIDTTCNKLCVSEPVQQMLDRFCELLMPHRADLERYCRAMLRSPDEVADVLQEATVRALRDFPRFQAGTCFRAFAFRYVVHEVRNQQRRRSALSERESSLEREPVAVTLDLQAEALHDALLTAPQTVLDHCQDEIRAALLRLPAPQRAAFLLLSLGGFRTREVAELLQMPLGTVLSLVFRARLHLRKRLAAVAEDRGLLRRSPQLDSLREARP